MSSEPAFDPTRPIVDHNMPRGCPECGAPVTFVRTDRDRRGLYEVWDCTKAGELGHKSCEDPRHGDGTIAGPSCNRAAEHPSERPWGRYSVREAAYRRAFSRRRRARQLH